MGRQQSAPPLSVHSGIPQYNVLSSNVQLPGSFGPHGTVQFENHGFSRPVPAVLDHNTALNLVDGGNRHWNPHNDFVASLFTSERQMHDERPRDTFQLQKGLSEEENIFNLFQKPRFFSQPTETRSYARFLDEIRLYMVAQNTISNLWLSTFKAYLEGDAVEMLYGILEGYEFITFQDAAIQLGEILCPRPNPMAIELTLNTLRWDCSKDSLPKLANKIRQLLRQSYPGIYGHWVVTQQSAFRFLQLLPKDWRRDIQRSCPIASLDHYLKAAIQLFDLAEADSQQDRYMDATADAEEAIQGEKRATVSWKTGRLLASTCRSTQDDRMEQTARFHAEEIDSFETTEHFEEHRLSEESESSDDSQDDMPVDDYAMEDETEVNVQTTVPSDQSDDDESASNLPISKEGPLASK